MILALDTSTPICSVAVTNGEEIRYSQSVEEPQIHIRSLVPMLKSAQDHIPADELEGIAVAIGPGSFNGLRIGLATAKAFAWARDLPIIPIPGLDGLALAACELGLKEARAVLYSHRDYIHYADYQLQAGVAPATPEMQYGQVGDVLRGFKGNLIGDARGNLHHFLEENPGFRFYAETAKAARIGILAAIRSDTATRDYHLVEPRYNAIYQAKKWTPPAVGRQS